MGVAYDADLHLTQASYTPADWALATDDAKAQSSVVQNNSWGFDDDLNPDVIKAYMAANPTATLAEALVAYQAITNEGTGDAANDTVNDVGNGAVTWTAADWNAYFTSVKSFQEQGVIVFAISNDNNAAMGITGGTVKTTDASVALPYLDSSLGDAWITCLLYTSDAADE